MEYAAPIWDPFYDTDIYELEKVQRRVARWILSRTTSVTSLLSVLNIPTLQQRRQLSRLRLRDTLYYRKSKLRERNVFALVWF